MRGRLINPFLVAICRLDTSATQQAGAYDSRFRTVRTIQSAGPDRPGVSGRREMDEVRIPAQIEPVTLDKLTQGPGGDVADDRIMVVMHMGDLERLKLIDRNGDPMLRKNDRLDAIYTMAGQLERSFHLNPVYATEVRPMGFGLGARRNLLFVVFESQAEGLKAST